LEVQPFRRLATLAKENVNSAVVESLAGWPLDHVRAIVILSPAVDALSILDLAALDSYLHQQGGRLVVSPQVGAALLRPGDLPSGKSTQPQLLYDGLVQQWGNLYVAQKGIAVLFEDKRHDILAPFWREVLGLGNPQPGYRIVTDRSVFHYHIGPDPAPVRLVLPYEAQGFRYDHQGRPVERLHDWRVAPTLGRREYILLNRVARSMPWVE
jgi:hypothetical protein